MKKILTLILLTAALSANAFWNNNNWNNMPWGGGGNYGNQSDNGIFGYNPYDFWDPRWYSEEMSNMVDEFDDNDWGNNNYGYNPHNYSRNYGRNHRRNYDHNPYNHRRNYGYNFAPNHTMDTPWGAGIVPAGRTSDMDK